MQDEVTELLAVADLDRAVEVAQRWLAAEPKSPVAALRLVEALYVSLRLEEAIISANHDLASSRLTFNHYDLLGRSYERLTRYEKMRWAYEASLHVDGERPMGTFGIFRYYLRTGQYRAAVEQFERHGASWAPNPRMHWTSAVIFCLGTSTEVAATMQANLERSDLRPRDRLEMGCDLMEVGALAQLSSLLRDGVGGSAPALLLTSAHLGATARTDAALTMIDLADTKLGGSPLAAAVRARVLFLGDRVAEGLAEVEKALAADYRDGRLLRLAAQYAEQRADWGSAARYTMAVIDLQPATHDAIERLLRCAGHGVAIDHDALKAATDRAEQGTKEVLELHAALHNIDLWPPD